MLRPLVRSLFSAVAAACFALSATTGGAVPLCSGQGSMADHAAHGAPGHPAGHHGAPARGQGCVVHLCCAHLLVAPPASLGTARLIAQSAGAGFAPSTQLPVTRAPHTLPFAHGPPAPLV